MVWLCSAGLFCSFNAIAQFGGPPPDMRLSHPNFTEFDSMSFQCRACHGENGNAPQFPGVPSIGNHTRDYFIHALNAYRRGDRKLDMKSNPYMIMMTMSVSFLTDEDVEALADHFTDAPYRRELLDFPEQVLQNNSGRTILLFGASGSQGQELAYEALSRGFTVIGVSRNPARLKFDHPNFIKKSGDLTDLESVRSLLQGSEVEAVISAAASAPSNTSMMQKLAAEDTVQVKAAEAMIELLPQLGAKAPRFIQVGGATSLNWKGVHAFDAFAEDHSIMGPMPSKDSGVAAFFLGNVVSLDRLRASGNKIRWTNITPGLQYDLGPRTGVFRYGDEEMIVDKKGFSRISRADMAVAIMDELDNQDYINKRFTISY